MDLENFENNIFLEKKKSTNLRKIVNFKNKYFKIFFEDCFQKHSPKSNHLSGQWSFLLA
jgi:hypothetical protein